MPDKKKVHDAIIFFEDARSPINFEPLARKSDSHFQTSVEGCIFNSYTKMDRLSLITYNAFNGTSIERATKLNVFIDLNSVLHSIFSSKYRTQIKEPTILTSAVINMCAHYRTFFKSLSVYTTFYIINSSNTCDIYEKFVQYYNKGFKDKYNIPMFRAFTDENIEYLKLLCPYLPNIHFINSTRGYETSVIIAHLIRKIKDPNPNLIISRDLYPLQLCTMYPNTSILFPIKSHSGDRSIMVPLTEKETHREEFWNIVAHRRKISTKEMYRISPINFPLFSALFRFPERYLLPIMSASSAVKVIEHFVGSSDLKISISQLYNDPKIFGSIPVTIVENRWKVLDVEYMLPYYEQDIECKDITLENLQDNEKINFINAKFFENNPIDLGHL